MRRKRKEEKKTPKPKAPAGAGNFAISSELLAKIRATKIDETEPPKNVLNEGKLSKDQKELLRLITVKKMIEELKILEEEGRTGDTSAIEALYQIADKSTHLLFRIATEHPTVPVHGLA